jgi:alanine dehydrogenase
LPPNCAHSVGFENAGREVDSATVAEARVAVEARASVPAPPPAGSYDLRVPIDEGLLDSAGLVEIGELIHGTTAVEPHQSN